GPQLLGGGTVGRHEPGVGIPKLETHGLARRVEGRHGRLLGLLRPGETLMPQAAPKRCENEFLVKVLVRRPSLTGAVSPGERLVEGGLRNPRLLLLREARGTDSSSRSRLAGAVASKKEVGDGSLP